MVFTDAFSVMNPFAVNPQYSETPAAAAQKALQAKAAQPKAAVLPSEATSDNYSGVQSLQAARTSPLMEAIAPQAQAAPPNVAPVVPVPPQTVAMPQYTYPNQYTNPVLPPALLRALGEAQAAQQYQRMYPNKLVYV